MRGISVGNSDVTKQATTNDKALTRNFIYAVLQIVCERWQLECSKVFDLFRKTIYGKIKILT